MDDETPSLRASCHAALLVSLQPRMTPKTEEGLTLFSCVMALSAADTSSGVVLFVPRHRTYLEDRPEATTACGVETTRLEAHYHNGLSPTTLLRGGVKTTTAKYRQDPPPQLLKARLRDYGH